jgi:hypothetical protein
MTLTLLVMLVALPLSFIALQAMFPNLAQVLAVPLAAFARCWLIQLPAMLGGTCGWPSALRW